MTKTQNYRPVLQSWIYKKLGFTNSKLPADYSCELPGFFIATNIAETEGFTVDLKVLPASGEKTHRIIARCPECKGWYPLGRLHQHVGTQTCKDATIKDCGTITLDEVLMEKHGAGPYCTRGEDRPCPVHGPGDCPPRDREPDDYEPPENDYQRSLASAHEFVDYLDDLASDEQTIGEGCIDMSVNDLNKCIGLLKRHLPKLNEVDDHVKATITLHPDKENVEGQSHQIVVDMGRDWGTHDNFFGHWGDPAAGRAYFRNNLIDWVMQNSLQNGGEVKVIFGDEKGSSK